MRSLAVLAGIVAVVVAVHVVLRSFAADVVMAAAVIVALWSDGR